MIALRSSGKGDARFSGMRSLARPAVLTLTMLFGGPIATVHITIPARAEPRSAGSDSPRIADTTSFWVWHRDRPLDAAEVDGLDGAGVDRLFWHWADLEYRSASGWRFPQRPRDLAPVVRSAGGIDVVPVVRLTAEPVNMADPVTFRQAAEMLAVRLAPLGVAALQVDYDCPDRLLGRYAEFLRGLREAIRPGRLSATALAAWPRHPDFPDLEDAVDELFPMFYDLEPDTPDEFRRRAFRSPADWDSTAGWVRSWRNCTVPWHAGLANFSRVTVFEPDGTARGHLRSWNWRHLVYHPDLEPELIRSDGVLVLRPRQQCVVANVPIGPDQTLVFRRPPLPALARLVGLARECGAVGTAWFRLPDAGEAPEAWSVATLTEAVRDEGAAEKRAPGVPPVPELDLLWQDNAFVLANTGPVDLPAFGFLDAVRSGPDRGTRPRYRTLQIRGPFAFCEDILPGAFNSAGRAAGRDRDDPGFLPGTIELLFSELPSGVRLTSGAVFLGPTARSGLIEWRVDAMPWRSLPPFDRD